MKGVRLPLSPSGRGGRTGGRAAPESLPGGPSRPCEPQGGCAARRPAERGREQLSPRTLPPRLAPGAPANTRPWAVSPRELSQGPSSQRLETRKKFPKDSSSPLPAYLSLINNVLKSETLTQAELRYKKRAMVEMLKLDQKIKRAQIQQEPLIKEIKQLNTEKSHVQAENKIFLDYLANKTEEYRKQPETVWNNYIMKTQDIERRKNESAVKYAKQTLMLKRELLQKETFHHSLKQQLENMRNLSMLKVKQDAEIKSLEKQHMKTEAETHRKVKAAQFSLLQEKALLEKQLSEPDMWQPEKRKKFNKRIQALELAAKQYTSEYYRNAQRESLRLQSKLLQLTQQCQELHATKNHLKKQMQKLQQEQWYMESLRRGRQRLQSRHNWCSKEQGVSETAVMPPLGTKSSFSPK